MVVETQESETGKDNSVHRMLSLDGDEGSRDDDKGKRGRRDGKLLWTMLVIFIG
jgi:hypothetical protein